ncbi:MAG: translation initiation factor IF-2 [Spirochaetaceae bacterium]|nr:translation initiation factor IF-2 [Spirochaetaceae bacterium]
MNTRKNKEYITDNEATQKPKTELIKKPKESLAAPGEKARVFTKKTAAGEVKAEDADDQAQAEDDAAKSAKPRKKVVVTLKVRKKSDGGSLPPASAAAAASASPSAGDTPATPPFVPEDAPNTVDKAPETREISIENKPGVVEPSSQTASSRPPSETAARNESEVGGNAPAAERPPVKASTPWTVSQRPAVQVGKVGGKFVGPRRPDDKPYGEKRGDAGKPGEKRNFRNDGGGGFRRQNFNGPHPAGGNFGQGGWNRQGNFAGGRPPVGGRPPLGGRPAAGGRPVVGGRPPPRGAGGMAVPPPAADKGAAKRSFKAKKPAYQRRDKEIEMEEKLLQTKKRTAQIANPVPKSIDIMEIVTISELARKMNLKASDLIQKLMSMGQMVTINQQIDSDTAAILAAEFGADVKIVNLYEETLIETETDDENAMTPRPPVVTVMGHVDHGKTKLLDAIRSADVASGEAGGITQHIGAYMVETAHGNITFLDTPGHEAFTRMRSRGAQVTDIVVLVVAADDGVMPQTIEAINHAKEAAVPIIVAVNKIDKPEANIDKVKSQLSELGLQPEEWGGQTMFVPISALKKEGIPSLIEAILLQAEILDLKADYNRRAEGKILESRIDQGRGIVASILIEKGTLEVGDSFVAGIWPGKVRALFNDKGVKVGYATPSMPVEVLGFEGIPNAGDPLQVVDDEKTARGYSNKRQELKRFEDAKNIRKITLDNLYDTISDGAIAELKVIIKGDVQGSVEALKSSLEKLSTKEVRLNVIQALPGAINEGDVDLAIASNAILIGFNVRPTPKAKALADQEKVDIRKYTIIYRVVEEMQQALEGLLKPDTKEEIIAQVEVRKVFRISKVGVIAGCFVQTGTVKRGASINVIRDDIIVYTGKIGSLRRIKDDVKEVAAGYECGINIEGFEEIHEGDQLEVFEIIEIARKLSDA